jgi:hypothetical protein
MTAARQSELASVENYLASELLSDEHRRSGKPTKPSRRRKFIS